MGKIKEYLVKSNHGVFSSWIVPACNAKEAIEKVWEQECFDARNASIRASNNQIAIIYKKGEFTARSIESLRRTYGEAVPTL